MARSMAATAALAGCISQGAAFAPGALASDASLRNAGLQSGAADAGAGAAPQPRSATTAVAAVVVAVAGAALTRTRRGGKQSAVACRAQLTEIPYGAERVTANPVAGMVGAPSEAERFLIGGDEIYDPLNIYLPWFREAELKHGRVAMLAWVGMVVPDFVRIPAFGDVAGCYEASSTVAAHDACVVGNANGLGGPLFQVFAFCGFFEMLTTYPKFCKTGNEVTIDNAGDYKLGINFLPTETAAANGMKLKELKNGRLAMLAFSGAITQAVATGSGFPWLGAVATEKAGSGFGASVRGASRVAMRAGPEGGYKMSKAVPFLPVVQGRDGDVAWSAWITTAWGSGVPGEPFANLSTLDAHAAMVKFGTPWPQKLCWAATSKPSASGVINAMEGKTDRKPGDFGIRTWYPKDEKGQYEMQLKELRNGRLAMLAFGGNSHRGPLLRSMESTRSAFSDTFDLKSAARNALNAVYTETNGLITLIFLAGYIESQTYNGKVTMLDMFEGEDDKVPGDFNFGSGFLKGKTDKEVYDMKLKELNNGRLAMLAFGGMVHHNLVVNGPLFPIFPDGWKGPQGTWTVNGFPIESMASRLVEEGGGNSPIGVQLRDVVAWITSVEYCFLVCGTHPKRTPPPRKPTASMARSMAATAALAGCISQGAAFAPGALASDASLRNAGLQSGAADAGAGAAPQPRSATTAVAAVVVAVAGAALTRTRRGGKQSAVACRAQLTEIPYGAERVTANPVAGMVGAPSEAERFLIGGDEIYDPLNIAARCPQYLPWFREAELKHGRVAMLAWVGMVVPDFVRIPAFGDVAGCYEASSTVAAHDACVVGNANGLGGPLFQVFAFCGFFEMLTTYPKFCKTGNEVTIDNAGDYKLGINFLPTETAAANGMKLKELKNGRLAMLAFSGAITQAVATGSGFPWLGAVATEKAGSGFGASVRPAAGALARGASRVAMRAGPEGGYKMSKAVPFLPVSPALEGYVGEEDGFDPIGMSLAWDIRWLREAELKHGRVAMLAVVGWITTDLGFRVPGEPFANLSTLDAHDAMVKFGSMPQMLCWAGYFEAFGFLAIINAMEGKTDRKPGDFGIRTWYPKDEKGQYEMQLKELRNGRLAMLAFGGIATAGAFSGKTWPFFGVDVFAEGSTRRAASVAGTQSSFCGASRAPQRSRTSAVAARAEVSRSLPFMPKPQNLAGYVGEEQEFDPLGFSDTFDMKWLRESELKHGRVCMLATVGFATQQYATFPGMAPTENALNAVYTETNGLITLIFLAGYIESQTYNGKVTMLDMFEGEDDKVPGDFNFGSGFLKGKTDKEVYDMKLKELNNGRLAMLAFGGMVHHNLVVNGPLFPIFPDGWKGPQGTWTVNGFPIESMASRLVEEGGGNSPIGVQNLF
ncbi:unnamed protein product [Prorocentrum cordatum]|uniref:Plastid light harvesting protein n=1 Tax=Prorocentrum cordatum TaxID=2364126 RepID=A0ABN9WVS4_9DINO|nr:unnamed protein product [Polarella glacialis]